MKTTADPKPHRLTVRFNRPDFTRLSLLAEQHELTLADVVRLLVRRAPASDQPVRKVTATASAEWARDVGAGGGGQPDL